MNAVSQLLSSVTQTTPKRLRDLIRDIRAVRTAAEERAIVNRECAQIRDGFREEDSIYRARNVAKLLYMYMLGYPAHFGILECLKLIASQRYSDKRIGYLGAMLLLDERTELHLLITNSLKNDLNHSNQYVASLSLSTLGSICSVEMSRDLAGEVEKLMRSSNAYVKKKAVLCAARIVRKVPDLVEVYMPVARNLLNEKNHSVLLASVILIGELCQTNADALGFFKKLVPQLTRLLKSLIMSGYSPEHDVSGVTDPFLQVHMLRLLRVLGCGDAEAAETMNDVLAQVATNTDTSKNVGNAILHETVLTIMGVKAESGLRVLAVNILGRFLVNTDKNIRYVALNTLLKVVHADAEAVQRHRTTILECLKDADVSIRKRAMELSFALVNASNVRQMMKDLLAFLQSCDPEFKADSASNIVIAAERFAVSKRWLFDTILKVLTLAGNYARDDVVFTFVQLVNESHSPQLQAYAAHELFRALQSDQSQQPLVQAAAWCIGEFGDLLDQPLALGAPNEPHFEPVVHDALLDVFERVLLSTLSSPPSKAFVTNALMKLSTRFTNEATLLRIRHLISYYSTSIYTELQQRSVEYGSIFTKHEELRRGLLERMPQSGKPRGGGAAPVQNGSAASATPGVDTERADLLGNSNSIFSLGENLSSLAVGFGVAGGEMPDLLASDTGAGTSSAPSGGSIKASTSSANSAPVSQSPLDLQDLLGDTLGAPSARPPTTSSNAKTAAADLFELGSSQAPSKPQPPASTAGGTLLDGLFGGDNSVAEKKPAGSGGSGGGSLTNGGAAHAIPSITAFEKSGVKVVLGFVREPASDATRLSTLITAQVSNASASSVEQFVLQAAVPKQFQLQMLSPSGLQLPANSVDALTQPMRIISPPQQPIRMRLRLQYQINGRDVVEQTEVNNFPPSLWQ